MIKVKTELIGLLIQIRPIFPVFTSDLRGANVIQFARPTEVVAIDAAQEGADDFVVITPAETRYGIQNRSTQIVCNL